MSETIDRRLWVKTLWGAVEDGVVAQLQTASYDESEGNGSFMIVGQLCGDDVPGSFCCRIMNGNDVMAAAHFDYGHIVEMDVLHGGRIRVVIQ